MQYRLMSRLFSFYTSKHLNKPTQNRLFFKERQEIYKSYSLEDKINVALNHKEIEDAEIGFYKGLGYHRLGLGYELDAIEAFIEAIRLDSKKMYTGKATQYIKKIREQSLAENHSAAKK